jgi:hypothetical protein
MMALNNVIKKQTVAIFRHNLQEPREPPWHDSIVCINKRQELSFGSTNQQVPRGAGTHIPLIHYQSYSRVGEASDHLNRTVF